MNPVRYELRGAVALLTMDDGKANALNDAMLEGLRAGLGRARQEAKSVVLAGRADRFSAGFDLRVLAESVDAASALVARGAELLLSIYTHPQPVVAACTGHAIAGGAVMLLCCDRRIGAAGDFKIGLTEVRIGMPMPLFVSSLARDRLTHRRFEEAVLGARVYDPPEAAQVGFLDEVVEADAVSAAVERAAEWGELSGAAYASTKKSIRTHLAERLRAGLVEDVARACKEMQAG